MNRILTVSVVVSLLLMVYIYIFRDSSRNFKTVKVFTIVFAPTFIIVAGVFTGVSNRVYTRERETFTRRLNEYTERESLNLSNTNVIVTKDNTVYFEVKGTSKIYKFVTNKDGTVGLLGLDGLSLSKDYIVKSVEFKDFTTELIPEYSRNFWFRDKFIYKWQEHFGMRYIGLFNKSSQTCTLYVQEKS